MNIFGKLLETGIDLINIKFIIAILILRSVNKRNCFTNIFLKMDKYKMKNFTIIYEELIEEQKELIFEEIYINEVFDKLLNFCYYQFISKNEILKIDYNQLVKLLNSNWSGIKKLSKTKGLWLLYINDLNKLAKYLTENELSEINSRLKNDDGIFVTDLKFNKNIGIIIINEIPIRKYKSVLMHELIHFFQWNTGKSMHQFINNEQQINIPDTVKKEISDILNIDLEKINDILKYIQNAKELEPLINTIYNELKIFCEEHELRFNRLTISSICESFKSTKNISFTQYYTDVVNKLDIFSEVLNLSCFKFLLLLRLFQSPGIIHLSNICIVILIIENKEH